MYNKAENILIEFRYWFPIFCASVGKIFSFPTIIVSRRLYAKLLWYSNLNVNAFNHGRKIDMFNGIKNSFTKLCKFRKYRCH